MKKLSSKVKLTAIAAALGMSLALPAQADVLATAILDLTNFRFVNTVTGETVTNGNEITIQSGNNSGNLSAKLFSVGGTEADSYSVPILGGGQFDGVPQLQGTPGRSNNDFSAVGTPVIANNAYAYSDNLLQGAAVGGLPVAVGVHAGTIAEVMINTDDTGNATSTTGTNTTFDFDVLGETGDTLTIGVEFDYIAQALAFVSNDAAPFSGALADIAFKIDLFEVVDDGPNSLVKTITPGDLNQAKSLTEASPGTENFYVAGSFSGIDGHYTLEAGKRYQLTIGQQVQVNAYNTLATEVPEPGTLLLLGLGLLGLVATPNLTRRRG